MLFASRRLPLGAAWRVPLAGLIFQASAATAVALTLCSLLFLLAGTDPRVAFVALFDGAFGSLRAVTGTLVKATPLIFTGLAAAIAFRARIWNIGAEGQVFAGAMMAFWWQSAAPELPAILQVPVVILGALTGGALLAGLAGVLRTACQVNEVISTVLLNYIIVFALSLLLLNGPWSEAGAFYEQTARVAEASRLPILIDGTKLHAGFLMALAAVFVAQILINRTPVGYEIRAAGSNLRALEVQGMSAGRIVLMVLLISGAFAGLGGATEVYGVDHRLQAGILVTLGYTGIVVAILGRLNPVGVLLAAILFGALLNGATTMQVRTGVPTALIYAIQAIVLLVHLAFGAPRAVRRGGLRRAR